MLYIVCVFSVS